ncbi:MAG: YkvA family protein [Nocardioidaceae bacterium]
MTLPGNDAPEGQVGAAMWWQTVIGILAGLLLLWLVMLVMLWRAQRGTNPTSLRDALRLLPDTVRLLRRLAADRSLPQGVRIRLALLLVYLASPIDLVPDFVPVLGYADDAIVVAIALRSVVRHTGRDALDRHWPGTADGLVALTRLVGIRC